MRAVLGDADSPYLGKRRAEKQELDRRAFLFQGLDGGIGTRSDVTLARGELGHRCRVPGGPDGFLRLQSLNEFPELFFAPDLVRKQVRDLATAGVENQLPPPLRIEQILVAFGPILRLHQLGVVGEVGDVVAELEITPVEKRLDGLIRQFRRIDLQQKAPFRQRFGAVRVAPESVDADPARFRLGNDPRRQLASRNAGKGNLDAGISLLELGDAFLATHFRYPPRIEYKLSLFFRRWIKFL